MKGAAIGAAIAGLDTFPESVATAASLCPGTDPLLLALFDLGGPMRMLVGRGEVADAGSQG